MYNFVHDFALAQSGLISSVLGVRLTEGLELTCIFGQDRW